LFTELELPRRYQEYEQATYEKLNALIDAIPEVEGGLKRDVFRRFVKSHRNKHSLIIEILSFLSKIYKRSK
jgi:hypothetical protein